ncbi:Fur family transcriptional regulator [Sporosarcina limicola]|uniref:Fur family zinc uptake transcriptional regulator n=1 Tax=Sporosarcina limicola TaxID=34101 RepID=A0A927MH25_9BACL|nr:Fur family transcriptional regulator [Sporosarcina limicola]MBE1553738.1 Fur family zinc uptake transcriptional regulator [Sporosarcina limicola]
MNLDEAWRILQENQFKRTKNREAILQFFSINDRYLTALEVKNFMEDDNPGISFDTIYRNLSTFEELGILEETDLNGERHFRMQCNLGKHHHHFICTACGKTRSILHCPMEMIAVNLPDYEIEGHKFEIYGKCPACIPI